MSKVRYVYMDVVLKYMKMKKDVNDGVSIFQHQQEETTCIHTTIYQYELRIQNTNT
jgi:hypothetical protein